MDTAPQRTNPASNAERTSIDEDILLRRLAEGDITAFWTLWEPYRQNGFPNRCLHWMGGHPEDAEDALSSASLRAFQQLPMHAHEIINPKAWLTRLLDNHCKNLRKADQSRLQYVKPVGEPAAVARGAQMSVQESVEEVILRHELQSYLRRAIERLPPRLCPPLVLFYFHGMSHQDIATHLNLSATNVRKRLQQARDILREQLRLYLFSANTSEPRRHLCPRRRLRLSIMSIGK